MTSNPTPMRCGDPEDYDWRDDEEATTPRKSEERETPKAR